MRTRWACYAHDIPVLFPGCACDAGGVYDAKDSGGPAEKHTRETTHPTWARMEAA